MLSMDFINFLLKSTHISVTMVICISVIAVNINKKDAFGLLQEILL